MIADADADDALSPDFPLGVELEVFIRREDAERFVEKVRGDDPELASYLRIEERELEALVEIDASSLAGDSRSPPASPRGCIPLRRELPITLNHDRLFGAIAPDAEHVHTRPADHEVVVNVRTRHARRLPLGCG